jgi:hypothetical protein
MTRNIIGVVIGLAVWVTVSMIIGTVMRSSWTEYASVAEALTFTLPMMIARLSIGAFATVLMGLVTACITQSKIARPMPGFILLAAFIPEHVMLWDKFPIWYHLTFLLSLVPLTYVGNSIAAGVMRARAMHQPIGATN